MNGHNKVINEITEKVFKTSSLKISQVLDKGITNYVYIIDLPESKIVVRISKEPNTAQFEKEKWEMKQASLLNIPTPKILDIGIHNNTVYMIQEYIDGTHGTDSSLDTTHIWRALGEYAKIIHSIPVEGVGDHMESPGKFVSNRKGFTDYVEYNITSLNPQDKLLQMGILTSSKFDETRTLFENLKDEHFTFGLSHGDLSLKNVIVGKNGKIFLFDWGSSTSHIIPHFDFMEVLEFSFHFDFRNKDFISFLHGYGFTEEQFLTIRPSMDKLFLLSAIDKIRWAIDKKPEKIEQFKKRFTKISEYLRI